LTSVIVLLVTRSAHVATVAIFAMGCGLAGSFPIVLSFAADRYAELSGTALGVVMTMALAGGMLMPYVAGVLGASVGLRGAFVLVPASLAVLMVLLTVVARRIAAPPLSPSVVTR